MDNVTVIDMNSILVASELDSRRAPAKSSTISGLKARASKIINNVTEKINNITNDNFFSIIDEKATNYIEMATKKIKIKAEAKNVIESKQPVMAINNFEETMELPKVENVKPVVENGLNTFFDEQEPVPVVEPISEQPISFEMPVMATETKKVDEPVNQLSGNEDIEFLKSVFSTNDELREKLAKREEEYRRVLQAAEEAKKLALQEMKKREEEEAKRVAVEDELSKTKEMAIKYSEIQKMLETYKKTNDNQIVR